MAEFSATTQQLRDRREHMRKAAVQPGEWNGKQAGQAA
jgi:hypothetical protein